MMTLDELRQAYATGSITKDEPLWLDNDQTAVRSEDGREFEMHPRELLEQALDLLGIPWESV